MAFIFLEHHGLTAGCSLVEPSTQYRKLAEECRRFASLAKTAEQRKQLEEMEAVWTKLAEEADNRDAKQI